ncbi:beta strand repeat-containing protein [Klebsiella quasipneumoniae]|uniref:beta strand repeat-containing protein n=1 Tax=Klebsiella quasipneumoniae TaxID=1463165 RepID=UPI003D00E7C5
MVAQVLLTQQEVAAIQYAVLGNNTYTSATAFDSVAGQFRAGTLTHEAYITSLINSSAGQLLYSGKSDLDVLKEIYIKIHGSAPSDTELQGALNSSDLASSIANAIDTLLNYNGFDSVTSSAQQSYDAAIDKMMYKEYGTAAWNQWNTALTSQEQVAASFLTLAGRAADMAGLSFWTTVLTQQGKTFDFLLERLIGSSEMQSKGTNLTGDSYINYIYKNIYGVDASSAALATYGSLGTDKTVIAQAIINDLRNSTSTDISTVTAQHAFENTIGTSLLYKTGAILTATAGGGNATGTVNTNSSHQISNAETAVLTNVQLNANAATTVNLKFADHLANLEIGGGSAATVNLSDNGVNPGVNITVDNGSITLNASSGADKVLLTTDAVVASATGKFNLGTGNDSLKWLGNGVSNGANTVSTAITANGGDGVDTISANLITKNVVMSGNAVTRTATISTNTSQFTNFEKLDLAGYIGKATVSSGSTAANHTFDFGILTGNAVSESSTTGLTNNVVQAATSTIGSQGFVLSGLADQVHVINAAGGNSAQLEVTGNATAASSVDITFLQNATNHFDVNFTATSDSDINAGSLSLISSSSVLGGTALSTVNIGSGGSGDFENTLTLTGTNAQVQTINVTGDHALNLTVGSGYNNVHDIIASSNTGGLDLNANVGGTGDGIITQLLKILPLSAVTVPVVDTLLSLLGLNSGYHMSVEGTSTNDSFNVLGNTVISGGDGENQYQLKSSTINSGVTISDFSSLKDTIFDSTSGLTLSDDTSGTAVADYGTRSTDVVDALLGTLVGGITGGVVALLGQILGVGSDGSLTSKVGVASVVWSGQSDTASSYVIIDNNDNHNLDSSDTVIYLAGQNHQQLVDTLHYA